MPSTHHGILIHVVFSTKQRFKLINESLQDELYAVMGGIVKEHKSTLIRAGGIEDHVHLFLTVHPSFAIADTVKLIKGNSSRWINENRKIDARFEWQRGYGAFSVSQSMADTSNATLTNKKSIIVTSRSRMSTWRCCRNTRSISIRSMYLMTK